jgi:outer membrane protein OmpA-like peptidoglycan-associated protein
MAEDWAADVKKFVPDADDTVIAAIVRYCGIALQNRDSSLVSFTDPVETGRVRENFLKKKLGLTHGDEILDQAIAAVGERMKGVNFRNRVTVYYLLLEHFGLLHLFGKGAGATAAEAGAAGAAAIGIAGLGAAGVAAAAPSAAAAEPLVPPEPVAPSIAAPDPVGPGATAAASGLYGAQDEDESKAGGFGWWPWLLLALLALALLWWLFFRWPSQPSGTVSAGDERGGVTAGGGVVPGGNVTADETGGGGLTSGGGVRAADLSAAPAEGTVTIPAGAGVTAETRNGKPVVKVYFDTGKTDVAPAFTGTADGLKAWLAAHSGSTLAVSGYNDKTGNAAANAELSKERAKAVKAALVASGIPDASVALEKPADTTDTSGSNAAARRVEVTVD